MKPRASASFCHCPKDSSTPPGHVGPSCVSSPEVSRATTSAAPARSTAATTAGSSSSRGTSPKPTVCSARNSKRKKSWNAPQPRTPLAGRDAREWCVVEEDRTRGRLVHLRQQLNQGGLAGAVLSDDRDHRSRGQLHRHIVEHGARGARIGERHVFQPDAVSEDGGNRRSPAAATEPA